jgi:hypothetical protein
MKNFFIVAMMFIAMAGSAQDLAFTPQQMTITGPMTLTNGILVQPCETGITNSGRMSCRFKVANAAEFAVAADVRTAGAGGGSFYVNIDGEPVEPEMVWEIPATRSFALRVATWGRSQTNAKPAPKYFQLAAGEHELIVRGRSAGVEVRSLLVVQRPAPASRLHAGSP